ncbi:hypothetical protein FSP39_011023 [Pinctada imbricata]|uniref:Caspase-2 n=1 Tax=Pinctada imbricata TaxID=66713 RepID=A0AA88YPJ8_PINIB|nr:hypothetical protein FSP39_011023 [Pinctada imbricata]
MEKEHKDILLEKRVDLVDNINIEDGLLSQLLAKKIFKPRTIHKIQACKTPESQIECLLDALPLTGNKTYDKFCEALIEDGQEHVVELFLKPKVKEDETKSNETSNQSQNAQTFPNQNVSQSGNPIRPSSSPPKLPTQPVLSAPDSLNVEQVEPPPPKLQPIAHYNDNRALVPSQNQRNISQGSHPVSIPSSSNSAFLSLHNPPASENDGHTFAAQRFAHTNSSQPFPGFAKDTNVFPNFTKDTNGFYGSNNNNASDFTNIENRYQNKHYIDDPNYREPPLLPPSSVPLSSLSVPFHSNIFQGRQEMVYVTTSRIIPSKDGVHEEHERSSMSRSDSLGNAMTRNDQTESPAKRQRVQDNHDEEVIRFPIFNYPTKPPEPRVVEQGEVTPSQVALARVDQGGSREDPEVDSTDGAVAVRVETCTRQFYLANYRKAYSLRKIPRGKALIINVNEVIGKPARRGTDIDRDNLRNLLTQLHFEVTVYDDQDGLTAQEMADKLQDFAADPGHKVGEACMVCLLSHGEEGHIYGTDGKKLELDSVFNLFSNVHCKYLMGKPKIFVIQACRGGALDSGVSLDDQDEHDGSSMMFKQLPTLSDMIICFPTQTGYYAWRNRERGSWYIEALVQIFMKYAKSEDICTMLNRVNLLVSRKVSRCPQIEMDSMSQMSEYKSTLRMPHLFFFPGIGCA